MAEPPQASTNPITSARWKTSAAQFASLTIVLEIAFFLRVLAAGAVEMYARRGGSQRLCLFPDTEIYWGLARQIRGSALYQYVEFADIPHFAIRTPGYPLFLALCHALFGERTLAVRLVQAVLGVVSVYFVYELTRQFLNPTRIGQLRPESTPRSWSAPLIAGALAAVSPYCVLLSPLILSEAVFEPLMLGALSCLATLWTKRGGAASRAGYLDWLVALASGALSGAAVLVRPSWAFFVPVALLGWVVVTLPDRRAMRGAIRGAVLCGLGMVLVLGPWWSRNTNVLGRPVATALWFGASLYDGLNPEATGASDMSFLGDPAFWPLDEQGQDFRLTRRAAEFARAHPRQAIRLAAVKLGRYWSPWPNAEGFRSTTLAVASACVELPILALVAMGAWHRRRDPRAWVLLAGPLLYFCALHLVFASSMRYRIPGEMAALGLASLGLTPRGSGLDDRRPRGGELCPGTND
jgi:4-amino-4-deoxy-L-arabinose transferase-like glycosyltransferase